MASFQIGSNIKQTGWCSAEIRCFGNCPQFTDSGAGVTVYHLYNVSGCNYISKSSLVIDIKHKDATEWEPFATYTMGGYEGFAYTSITINDAAGYEFKATYKGMTKYYSIVAPCVPDWQCEQPFSGYEEDGCGNRRENTECVCVPDWQCRQPQDGYETDTNNCGEPDRFNENCMKCIDTDLLPCYPSPGSETVISKPGYYKGYFCATCPGTGRSFDYVPPTNWNVISCEQIDGWGTHGCCWNCIVILVELQYVDPCEGVSPNWTCEKDINNRNTGYKIDQNECYEKEYDDILCPLCEGVVCKDTCAGFDFHSQKCVDGKCVIDQLLEDDYLQCIVLPAILPIEPPVITPEEAVEGIKLGKQYWIKSTWPLLDLLAGLPYFVGMPILPGFRISDKP